MTEVLLIKADRTIQTFSVAYPAKRVIVPRDWRLTNAYGEVPLDTGRITPQDSYVCSGRLPDGTLVYIQEA